VLGRLESEVKNNPGNALAHYRYGLILARAGKRAEAIKQMRIALTKRAFDPDILKDLGWIYFLDGQFPQALKTLKGACSMIPKDPECAFYMGRTQMEMGNLQEATDKFLILTQQYPKYTPAFYYLGQSLGQQQKIGEAHYYLGVYYLKKREFKNAVVQLKQALKHLEDPIPPCRNSEDLNDILICFAEAISVEIGLTTIKMGKVHRKGASALGG